MKYDQEAFADMMHEKMINEKKYKEGAGINEEGEKNHLKDFVTHIANNDLEKAESCMGSYLKQMADTHFSKKDE